MSTYGTIKYTGFQDSGVVVGNTAYTNTVDLPTSDLEIGAVAFVSETSKMYMWTGSSWFNIAIANQAPTAISGNVASYDLAKDGTTTTVTLTSTDPEGLPLTWSSSVSGVTQAATVTNVDNVFTITPSTNDAHEGTINVTFSVTDGNNTETSLSLFILEFVVPNSQYTSTLVQATGTGTNLTFVDASTQTHTITNTDVVAGTFSPYRNGGYSVYLDGNDYISLGNGDLTIDREDFTIETWVNTTLGSEISLANNYKWYQGQNKGWSLSITSSGTIFMGASNGTWNNFPTIYTSTNAISSNQWSHIVICRDSGVISSYINGVKDPTTVTYSASLNQSNGASAAIAQSVIGCALGDNNAQFYALTGYLADFHFKLGSAKYTATFSPPTESLTVESGTDTLLFNKPFIKDESTNAYTISLIGNPQVKPFSPYRYEEYSEAKHGSSGYFNGSSSLTAPTSTDFAFDADFTVEAWCYLNSISSSAHICDFRLGSSSNNNNIAIAFSSSTGTFVISIGGINPVIGTTSVSTYRWYHVVACRNSGVVTLYVDGVSEDSASDNTSFTNYTNRPILGAFGTGTANLNGYISNLRVVKGTAVYTSNFTPPTAPLTAITNTTFLLNPNPNIVDKAQKSNITLVGDTTGSNTQQLFSSSTVKFDGTDDCLVVSSSSTDYGYGTGDFTIELWVYFNSLTRQTVLSNLTSNSSTNPYFYLLETDSKIKYYTGGVDRISSSALSANTWYHVALSRASGSTKLFIDGTQNGSTYTDSNNYGTTAPFVVGTFYNGGSLVTTNLFNGYVQDVRVTKGLARYTNSFTPPTTLLPG